MAHIVSVSLAHAIAEMSDGRILPVTNLIDEDGDLTNDEDEAVTFVCGDGNEWYADLIEDFPETTFH